MVEETTFSNEETEPAANENKLDPVWLACGGVITAIAAFLRFYWLELKPFHHDEGVNGFFLTTLFRDGTYHYDPANYHGPTLYYISLAFAKLFGLETIPVRASVAIFGVLTVVLALYLKRYLGRVGSLAAALFLTFSPGMVFISRYFIHEMFFVFCSLAVVVAVVFFVEKRKAGPFAIAWMALVLLVAFLPSALNLANAIGGKNMTAVWSFRAAFFILECVLVFFVLRMLLTWNSGRAIYLMLAAASVAMMFATKETAFITLGTMLIACFAAWLWRSFALTEAFRQMPLKLLIIGSHILVVLAAAAFSQNLKDGVKWFTDNFSRPGQPNDVWVIYALITVLLIALLAWLIFLIDVFRSNDTTLSEPANLTWANLRAGLGKRNDLLLILTATATVFIYLIVIFFSSFFSYFEGVGKAFEAYAIWSKTGSKDHTQNGLLAYLKWGVKLEGPILVVSTLGALIALLRAKHRFAAFTAFWAFGMFAAYTIIPYKTPWLALSFFLPMCLIGGYAVNELFGSKDLLSKAAAALLVLCSAATLAYQTYDLNFVRYDDEEMSYVYAHTRRGFLDMIRKIEYYADKSDAKDKAAIEIVSPDYWPMPWYMNRYEKAIFHGQLIDAVASEMIVAKKNDQDAEVVRRYSAHYKFVGVYALRPGVDLVLLVRKDLADPDAKDLYRLLEYVSP